VWSRGTDPDSLESLEVRLVLPSSIPSASGSADERVLAVGPLPLGFALSASPEVRGSIVSLDPFPWPGSGREGGKSPCEFLAWSPLHVRGAALLSHCAPSQGLFAAETRSALVHLARELGSDRPLWAWCDPRAFEPEGVRTTLATWRSACPAGRVFLVLDGYSGPLLGLQASGPEPASPDLERRTLARIPIGDLPRGSAGVATADRPLLAWQLDPAPSPSGLAKPAALRALAGALGLPPQSGVAGLLEGLARHAESQEAHAVTASSDDRIRIPEEELEAYRDALLRDPQCEPLVRHVAFVADLLFQKRDFDLLVSSMRAAVDVRPDSVAFHRQLGRALGELLDAEGSVVELEQAYSLDPGSQPVRIEFSKALARVKRFGEAARILESVWQENPAIEIAKGLGITYLEMKDYPLARRYLEYVHARSPGDVDVESALQRMDREGR